MKTYLLKLSVTLVILFLISACGGGSGGASSGSGGGHVVDSTPHDYTAIAAALTNTNQPHPVDMHQVCNFGLPGVRDESISPVLQDPSANAGIGCAAAANYVFEITNNGTDIVYFVISIDGVNQPQEVLQPGGTYTFTRGY